MGKGKNGAEMGKTLLIAFGRVVVFGHSSMVALKIRFYTLMRYTFLLSNANGLWCGQMPKAPTPPCRESYYHWIDRYEVKSGRVASRLFTSIKPYKGMRSWRM